MTQTLRALTAVFAFSLLLLPTAPVFARDVPMPPVAPLLEGSDVTATVTERQGRWTVEYRFAEPRRAMIFARSNGDYRTVTWTPLDEGLRLERIAGMDTMLFDRPSFTARFALEPYTGPVPQDYTPFIAFTDGGLALYNGQFEVLPVADRAEVERLQGNLGAWRGSQPRTGVRVRSDRRMLMNGEEVEGEAREIIFGGGTYVYVGDGGIVTGQGFAGVVDPGLPDWIREGFDDELQRVFEAHERLWGYELTRKAQLLFAFGGYDGPGFSNQGGVIDRLLVMQTSGEALRAPNERIRAYLLWFFAHEAAHIFQKGVGIDGPNAPDAWMAEGTANAMANRILVEASLGGDDYLDRTYRQAFSRCIFSLRGGSLAAAHARRAFDAHYDCGDLVSVVTEAALPEADIFDFYRAIQARAYRTPERRPQPEHWYLAMADLGASPDVIARVRRLVEETLDDPGAEFSAAMEAVRLAPQIDGEGNLASLSPDWAP